MSSGTYYFTNPTSSGVTTVSAAAPATIAAGALSGAKVGLLGGFLTNLKSNFNNGFGRDAFWENRDPIGAVWGWKPNAGVMLWGPKDQNKYAQGTINWGATRKFTLNLEWDEVSAMFGLIMKTLGLKFPSEQKNPFDPKKPFESMTRYGKQVQTDIKNAQDVEKEQERNQPQLVVETNKTIKAKAIRSSQGFNGNIRFIEETNGSFTIMAVDEEGNDIEPLDYYELSPENKQKVLQKNK